MPFAELYKKVFEKDGPGEDSVSLLTALVKEYPYFSLAHFYLLQQTPSSAENYGEVAGKAALHFNNPYLLQAQLAASTTAKAPLAVAGEDETLPHLQPELIEVEESSIFSENVQHYEVEEPEQETPAGDEKEEPIEPEQEEPQEIKYVPLDLPPTELEEVKEAPGIAGVPEEMEEVSTNNEGEETVEPSTKEKAEPATAEPQETQPVIHPVKDSQGNGVASSSQHQASPAQDTTMLFEPLHARDYFASQGIRLREEVAPADKLGKQLKSFTEWLKTMKKVHESGTDTDTAIDASVQSLAEKSNREEEVITEAMAEVFLQQGKVQKAREVYEKLSLLNPAKSAYFAAKIEEIK